MSSFNPWLILPVAAIVQPAFATEYLTIPQAQQALFAEASAFQKHFLHFSDEDKDRIEEVSDVRQRWDEQQVWRAEKDGQFLGWFLVDKVIGKHEYITYAAAISPEGDVIGIEIMDYRETYGDEVREASWREQFVGADASSRLKFNKDITNIAGATLSCRNVTNGVKRLLVIHSQHLK
jgi:Na+-translocating ferredoxin:NAD+ oxidoreductase RnfG subunit